MTVIAVITLVFGLWWVFGELQDALNTIWGVTARPGRGFLLILGEGFWSFRTIARTFKWLTLALVAYVASAFYARPDLHEVLRGTFIPRLTFNAHFMTNLVAILGTTISPYLFFWQASQEVEERTSGGRGPTRGLREVRADVVAGMLFSNVVMYFIMLATAATLFATGTSAGVQSPAEAAEALRPIAGDAAYLLFALGIIGSGFLAVPVLTGSSAYAVAEVFGANHGLDQTPRRAKLFYAMIVVSTVVGMLIDFSSVDPLRALFWTAVINGFVSAPMLVVIMLISSSRAIMGRRTNGPWLNAIGWATTIVMLAAAVGLIFTWGA